MTTSSNLNLLHFRHFRNHYTQYILCYLNYSLFRHVLGFVCHKDSSTPQGDQAESLVVVVVVAAVAAVVEVVMLMDGWVVELALPFVSPDRDEELPQKSASP